MARPLKKENELRTRIDIYLSPQERKELQEKASSCGLSFSAFARRVIIGQRLCVVPTISAEQWSRLSALSANINQLARHANQGVLTSLSTIPFDQLTDLIRLIRLDLTGARDDRKNN